MAFPPGVNYSLKVLDDVWPSPAFGVLFATLSSTSKSESVRALVVLKQFEDTLKESIVGYEVTPHFENFLHVIA